MNKSINIEEHLISFKTAKLAKEKGFNNNCVYAWCERSGYSSYNKKHEPITFTLHTHYSEGKNWNKIYKLNKDRIICSAPTQSLLQRWLREEHNIIVIIGYHYVGKVYTCTIYKNNSPKALNIFKESYEKTLEVGLYEALNLIK